MEPQTPTPWSLSLSTLFNGLETKHRRILAGIIATIVVVTIVCTSLSY